MHRSTVALAYSTAEYAAPVWSHSVHTPKIDVVLNDAMRPVSGCLIATPVENLPVFSGIAPANLRRNHQTIKLANKSDESGSLVPRPTTLRGQRIRRNHFATHAMELQLQHPFQPLWIDARWSEQWSSSNSNLKQFIDNPSSKPTGCDLDRRAWVNLNRLRTGVGRTNYFLHKIGAASSPNCECGEPQTINHIINDCRVYKSPRGIPGLKNLDDATITWLKTDLPL